MKRSAGLVFILLLASTVSILGQSVGVKGEKITYTRPEPSSEFKSTFTVNYPRITASSREIASKIESLLSYEKAFDFTIEEEKKDLQWLSEADFEVNYNTNGILSIELRIDGVAAYPDSVTKKLNIDTVRGVRLFPKDVFRNLPALAGLVKRKQAAEIAAARRAMRKDPDAQDLDPNEMFARANFRVAELNAFQVTERGVTFYYDYGFPHVVKALEPDGIYQLSWRDMRPFIKPGSLLAKAAR
ncbi:MAG: hypothetical protein IPM50_01660 [Acidobacteriota bacterium]|nr:MAG: hypothetical protein IPM50_01660 [Acidobacteriota bacterium]